MRWVRRFFSRVLHNRVGQCLVVTHFILVLYEFAKKAPMSFGCRRYGSELDFPLIADRGLGFPWESVLLNTIIIVDLPAIIPGAIAMHGLRRFVDQFACDSTESWIYAGVLLLLTSIQWLLIGSFLAWVYRRMQTLFLIPRDT